MHDCYIVYFGVAPLPRRDASNFRVSYMTVASVEAIKRDMAWRQRHPSQQWPEEVVDVVAPSVPPPDWNREAPSKYAHVRAGEPPLLGIPQPVKIRSAAGALRH